MNEAEQIQAEVSHQADMQNGRVVAEFLMDSSTCRCCQFIEERHRFQYLLAQYVNAKLDNRWDRRHLGDPVEVPSFQDHNQQIGVDDIPISTFDHDSRNQDLHQEYLKRRLDQMKPCFRCQLKYNPTGKEKFMGHRFWGWNGEIYIEPPTN